MLDRASGRRRLGDERRPTSGLSALLLRALLALLVASSVSFAPRPVAADAEAARFHDARARRLYGAGRYEAAIAEFFLSQRHAPNPGTLHNIAVCFQLLRRWDEAFLHYTEYLEQADSDDERRESAQRALREIEPRVARVRVTTDPPGATLFVDTREGGSYGVSPRLLAVPPGERRVEIVLEGYRPTSAAVTAAVGQESEVRVTLTPITGALSVSSNVDASVAVRTAEGALVISGQTPFDAALPPGPYVVELSSQGYVSRRELIAVEEDQRIARRVPLDATPVPTGELTVTSNVPGAVVQVDGRPAGFTPLALTDVPMGLRSVEVRGDGLERWRGRVDVGGEDRAWLTVSLEPERTATHSDVTWILGGAGIGGLVFGGVFAGLAADARSRFDARMRNEIRLAGQVYNGIADGAFALGATALAVAVVLFIVEEATGRARTSGTVTRRPL